MAVGKYQSLPFIHYEGIVCHDGEVEEHLVDLAIAISSDGYDAVGQGIEFFSHGLRVVPLGYGIARSEVEKVAEEEEHVALLTVEVGDDLVKGAFGTVDVGGYEVFHGERLWFNVYGFNVKSYNILLLKLFVKEV